jgi:hypothetical protein
MKIFWLIMMIISSFGLFGQKDGFNLPDNYNQLVINKTNANEVRQLFGKPDVSTKRKRSSGCITSEYPIQKLYYDKLGMIVWLERTKQDKKYKISWIYLMEPCNMVMAQSLKIGTSDYDSVLQELGNPVYENKISLMLQYYEKATDRLYYLLFDPDTKKLKEISITKKT